MDHLDTCNKTIWSRKDELNDVTIECLDMVKLEECSSFAAFQRKDYCAHEVHTLSSNGNQTYGHNLAQTCLYHFIIAK